MSLECGHVVRGVSGKRRNCGGERAKRVLRLVDADGLTSG